MKFILALMVLAFSLSSHGQAPLEGTWVLTNVPADPYQLHNTISFDEDGSFRTLSVPHTVNHGSWRRRWFHSDEYRLKSCLHSDDNPSKCRDFQWTWKILEHRDHRLNVLQTFGRTERHLEYEKVHFTVPPFRAND